MITFRAAYALVEPTVDFRLTDEDQSHLSDDELLAAARAFAAEHDIEGEVHIGEWKE